MFDIGFLEIVIILVVALVVIGPERMPEVARTVGRYVGKLRTFIANVKSETEFDKHRSHVEETLGLNNELNDLRTTGNSLTRTMDDIRDEFSSADFDDLDIDSLSSGSFRDSNKEKKADSTASSNQPTEAQVASPTSTETPKSDVDSEKKPS